MVFLTKSAAASEEDWSASAKEGRKREEAVTVRTNKVRVMPRIVFIAMAVGNAEVSQILYAYKDFQLSASLPILTKTLT